MIAKVQAQDFETVSNKIDTLIDIACHYQDQEVVRLMKQLVPEFKSNNSVYEELDKIEANPLVLETVK